VFPELASGRVAVLLLASLMQGEVEQIAMMKPKGQGPLDEGLLESWKTSLEPTNIVEPIQQSAARYTVLLLNE